MTIFLLVQQSCYSCFKVLVPELRGSKVVNFSIEDIGANSKYHIVYSFNFIIFPILDPHNMIFPNIFNHEWNFLIIMQIIAKSNIITTLTKNRPNKLYSLIIPIYALILHNIKNQLFFAPINLPSPYLSILSTLIPRNSSIIFKPIINLCWWCIPLIFSSIHQLNICLC